MSIDKDKLRALAEAATQGEWSHERFGVIQAGPVIQFANGSGRQQIAMATGADWMVQGEQIANAEFMAAANPSVVLALLAEIERLEGCDKAYAEVWERARGLQAEMDDIVAERDRLKAENEALRNGVKGDYDLDAWLAFVEEAPQLRKDAERYRFVSKLAWYVDAAAHIYNVCNVNAQWSDQRGHPDEDEVESAIDAVMAEEKSQ